MEQVKNENSLINYAMQYGLILGIFWVFKYMSYVGASYWQHFIYLYYLLNAGTFLLSYIFYFKYRDSVPGKQQRRLYCIAFIILLYMFAGLVELAARYVHIQLIDPTYFFDRIEPNLRALSEATTTLMKYPDDMKAVFTEMAVSKPFFLFSELLGNIFLGGFLGLILAWVVGDKKLN